MADQRKERPIVLLDLYHAADDLAFLLFSADGWMPEEDWKPLVEEMRTLLKAAFERFKNLAEKNAEALAADPEDLGHCVPLTLQSMEKALVGRFQALEERRLRERQELEELERLYGLPGPGAADVHEA